MTLIHFYIKKHSFHNLIIFYNTSTILNLLFNIIFMQPWLSTTDQNLAKTSLAMRLLEVFLDESIDIGLCMIPTLKTYKFVHNFVDIYLCACLKIVYVSILFTRVAIHIKSTILNKHHFKLSLTGCHKIKTNIFLLNFSSFL